MNLTGKWNSKNTNGTYYLVQPDGTNDLYWNGFSPDYEACKKGWANVGVGNIDGLTVTVKWFDPPNSKDFPNSGTETYKIQKDGTYLHETQGSLGDLQKE